MSTSNVEPAASKDSSSKPALELRRPPSYIKWVCASVCLVSGVFSSYAFKMQNRTESPICDGCESEQFNQPTMQTGMMFFGEACALVVYYVDGFFSRRAGKTNIFDFVTPDDLLNQLPMGKWWWWTFPAFLDLAATIALNIAQTITYASTVSMLRNFMVVVVAIVQMIILRRALKIFEWVGIVFITVAMFLAATPAIMNPDDSGVDTSKTPIGVTLSILGTSFQAVQIVFEEFLFRKGRYSPMKAVGVEGCSGMVYCAVVLPIMQATNYERPAEGFYQVFHYGPLMGITAGYLLAAFLFNAAGLGTTKTGGGLLRSVIFAVRAPIIWLIELAGKYIDFDYWNLAGVFVFCAGFFLHVGLYPSFFGEKLAAPVPCFCTREGNELKTEKDLEAAEKAGKVHINNNGSEEGSRSGSQAHIDV